MVCQWRHLALLASPGGSTVSVIPEDLYIYIYIYIYSLYIYRYHHIPSCYHYVVNLVGCCSFTSGRHLSSYQDRYRLVTVHSLDLFQYLQTAVKQLWHARIIWLQNISCSVNNNGSSKAI